MIPFEFSVLGTPVSQQTKNRQRLRGWKQQVRTAAEQRWPNGDPPETGELRVTVAYYYDEVPLDADNMVKPVLDALEGLVYEDDGQIMDVKVGKRNLDGSFRVRGMSSAAAEGFVSGQEFVHVKVEEAPDQRDLVG